jgi:hypothetical protein
MNDDQTEKTFIRKYLAISVITTAIFSSIGSFFLALTTFMNEAPVWCNYYPFSEQGWCNPLPCSSPGMETIECADTLFMGEKSHNPAKLKIETLRSDGLPTTSFHIDDSMIISVNSEHDGYIFVFNIEPDGKLINYFPNQYCHEFQQGYVKAGEPLIIPAMDWLCDLPVTGPIGTGTLIGVLVEETLEYNVLPLVFNKHIERQHAKSMLYLLSQQLETLTRENEEGEYVPVNWSVKTADYKIIR